MKFASLNTPARVITSPDDIEGMKDLIDTGCENYYCKDLNDDSHRCLFFDICNNTEATWLSVIKRKEQYEKLHAIKEILK